MNYYPFYWGRALQLKECFRAILRGLPMNSRCLLWTSWLNLPIPVLPMSKSRKSDTAFRDREVPLFLRFTVAAV